MGRSVSMFKGLIVVAAAAVGGAWVLAADAPKPAAKPKYEMVEIMNKGHKGNDSLLKKVTTGKATAEETKKLVEYYQSLALYPAPKGDEKAWKEKTTALLKAGEAVAAKKAGGSRRWRRRRTARRVIARTSRIRRRHLHRRRRAVIR